MEAKFWLHDLSVAVNVGFGSMRSTLSFDTLDRGKRPCWIPGMSILEIEVGDLRATSVECTATELLVTLRDGRRIVTPLEWYPRLKNASQSQRANYEIMPLGIHWPEIDEDLSVTGMMRGRRAVSR